MSKLTDAVVRAGVISPEQLQELAKWKLPVSPPEAAPFDSSEEAVAAIEDAQDSFEQVQVRVSDPDALRQYAETKRTCRLRAVMDEETKTLDWDYGTNKLGQILIPWADDVDFDILTNGETHLVLSGGHKVYFSRVEELYLNDKRALLLCTPRKS